jgi:hypothetical protein
MKLEAERHFRKLAGFRALTEAGHPAAHTHHAALDSAHLFRSGKELLE